MQKVITGVFDNSSDVDQALAEIGEMGYTESDVSVITKDSSINLNGMDEDASHGVAEGAKTGGIVGGLLGLLAGIGVLAIPGIGSLFIAGPIAAAFGITGAAATTASGALTGALVGGLVGAFKELGIDEVKAKVLEERVKSGDILILVYCRNQDSDINAVKDALEDAHADHVYELELKR